ncbi:hydrolase [Sphingobacterium sp. DK4209]|uniref:Hydrolase n=1 Tax=Sphingobacterium zhuxiongii TaxID=2662364 RepID=A0A5Q0Q7Z7_9SPHI|nr:MULTISPECIES: C40 family peptidase [unclassified Sphingobacterium]MVZ64253.1 hydrolase [Sphingobacterium sp. DK4209]QGA25603.1 hydrolase [Sphingobacterium sp. dk4302]
MNKKLIHIVCLSLFAAQFTYAQSDSSIFKRVQEVVTQAKQNFAPDKRTKIVALTQSDINRNIYIIESTEPAANDFINQHLKELRADIKIKNLPDSSVADKTHGVINLSVANLRTQPGNASEMATQAILGTQVDILQKDKGEYRVRTPEGYISWIPSSSVVPMDQSTFDQWKRHEKVIYTQEFGKSYSKPDLKSMRVSDLVYGNILQLIGKEKGFFKVAYPDKRIAYIPVSEALSFKAWLASRSLTSENVLSSAKTMMGLPYLWGGTSVKGVDCSGFTKTAFYMNGYVIPRDASQQVLAGDKIDILDADGHFDPTKALKNLKPADLLFFASGKNSNPNARVTHVAMYIGNGEFIHAAGSVRINSMLKDAANYDDFQTRTVVAARRYIGAEDPQIEEIKNNPYYK